MESKQHGDDWLNARCQVCGVTFHVKSNKLMKNKNHYCSRKCFYKAKEQSMRGAGNHQYGLRGEKNSSWKGGRRRTMYGYFSVYCPDHPFGDKNTHHVFEHRLVAEKYLLTDENSVEINGKRYLRPEYDVHHIDFDRANNDVSNLAVMTQTEHRRFHSKLNECERDEKTGRFKKNNHIVKFRKVVDTAKVPTKATSGSAGYDMYAETQEPVDIFPRQGRVISSGVAVSIPKGSAGFIFARSGLSTKQGLRPSTCVSVVDSDYRGVIGLPIFNDSGTVQTIHPHDRIAQIVFLKVLTPEIEIVDEFDDDTERGADGFGSTGK